MAYVTYTAKRSLISGHTVDTSYTIDFDPAVAEKSRKRQVEQQTSLGGTRDTLLHRIEYSYECGTDAVHHDSVAAWEEFLDSVAGGESFVLDMYGTSAVPVSPVTVTLDDDPSITRNSGTQYFNIRFTGVV